MSKFLPTSGFKWIDLKEFDSNKYTSNSSKGCISEFNLKYPKELPKLHNDNPLAPDKIKREMLSYYQLKIADLYNIPIGNVEILEPNFFDKEKYVLHHENLQLYLRVGLKLKKIHCVLEFNQHTKRIEAEKNNDKDGNALYKLLSNAIYG